MRNFIALFLIVCSYDSFAMSRARPTPSPAPTPVAITTPSPVPTPYLKIITLKCDSSCTKAEASEIPEIEDLMNRTILGQCFGDYLTHRKRIDMNQGFTGIQILAMLRKPKNLTLNYYNYSNTQVDGYEDAKDYSTVHFNRTAMKANGFDLCDKASLGGHELSHTIPFFHNGNLANPNYYTVPYTVNHGFDDQDDFGVPQADYGSCCPR